MQAFSVNTKSKQMNPLIQLAARFLNTIATQKRHCATCSSLNGHWWCFCDNLQIRKYLVKGDCFANYVTQSAWGGLSGSGGMTYQGAWRGEGHGPPCHTLIVIVMLMEKSETEKFSWLILIVYRECACFWSVCVSVCVRMEESEWFYPEASGNHCLSHSSSVLSVCCCGNSAGLSWRSLRAKIWCNLTETKWRKKEQKEQN